MSAAEFGWALCMSLGGFALGAGSAPGFLGFMVLAILFALAIGAGR